MARAQSFEVASVKVPRVVSGQPYDINLGAIQNDTVTLTNVSLADCMKFAYGLSSDFQLSGPDWIRSKELRYDIAAKAAPGTTRQQVLKMMQALLAERFKLALHHWTPDDRPIPENERGPSVFTAVQEQLGLRLVSEKGPMDVLVVDRAEKTPAEN